MGSFIVFVAQELYSSPNVIRHMGPWARYIGIGVAWTAILHLGRSVFPDYEFGSHNLDSEMFPIYNS